MKYYVVHIPIATDIEFVYASELTVSEGCRVLVTFNRRETIGICGHMVEVPSCDSAKYKTIVEVIDETPILSQELLALGKWISAYYHCPIAKALFAMLPGIMVPEVNSTVIWIGADAGYPPEFESLYCLMQDREKHNLKDLRKQLPALPFYRMLEEAEIMGLVEVTRKLKNKIKPKMQNFVELTDTEVENPRLTELQQEAMNLIRSNPSAVPLSELSDTFSYSILKALVKKGMIKITPRQVQNRSLILPAQHAPRKIVLTDAQVKVYQELEVHIGSFQKHLLFGVTGSGKTEIYIELIKKYIALGKGVIFLIPEIALTPQMVDRFFSVFGETLAIMHSQLSDRERYEEWRKIETGKSQIVIGARSAIFVPMNHLGLIIVDEEHEQSYKQDQTPRYSGRDLAIVRARNAGAQVVLGSATPSLESWFNVKTGNYQLHILNKRPLAYQLPQVELVDMRNENTKDLLSFSLRAAMDETLARKEQVILFQNRRGYSSFIQCLKCGELVKCTNCEISMYYHRDREELNCHYCGALFPVPRRCNKCGSYSFSHGAPGTQKIEQLLQIYYPAAKILRLDSDSASKKDMYRYMHDKMKSREVDILLGTQMISKGLDFEGVTLVGVVSADISLNVPDYRAAERTFQLLTQVAGRSGRGMTAGKVIIQAYNVDHYAIKHACNQDYESFANEELSYRKRLYYPPFFRLGRIVYQANDKTLLNAEMDKIEAISSVLRARYSPADLIILGPVPAPNAKVNNLYRYHIVLKASSPQVLSHALAIMSKQYKPASSLSVYIDVDPMMLM